LLTPANFLRSGRFTTFELVDLNGDLNAIPLQILQACRSVRVRPDKTLEELLKPEVRELMNEAAGRPSAAAT
jgi:hypothetical protein